MQEVRRITVGEGPTSAVVNPSGFKAFITNPLSNTISVVDLTQRAPVATIGADGAPLRGAFNRVGDRLYVIGRESPNLTVIDPARFVVTEKIFIGMGAASIKVDSTTGLILVGKKFGGEITIIDPFSLMFIDTIEVRGKAAFMTIDREENTLFVALPDKRVLQKVNLTSKKTVAEIEVGEGAYSVVVMGER
jgi:YVTN family beta-propeller protein